MSTTWAGRRDGESYPDWRRRRDATAQVALAVCHPHCAVAAAKGKSGNAEGSASVALAGRLVTVYLKHRMPLIAAGSVSAMPTARDAVLQKVWTAIRKAHPGVPDAEIRAVPGRRGSADASINWAESRSLVLVGARTIEEGPEAVLNFLLHQTAHGATPGGGVTSAYKGRWHTAEWKGHAENLGLEVSGTAQSVTALAEWGRHR
jgi:hypothetical protein